MSTLLSTGDATECAQRVCCHRKISPETAADFAALHGGDLAKATNMVNGLEQGAAVTSPVR